jgi:class 3 adenylate cyclase/TolB-like protein/Tfp pilus assembly protein PilF
VVLSRSQDGGVARQRKLAAILCADIAGFSRLMGEDEAATYAALSELRGAVHPLISRHGGRVVSTAGDGLLADFASIIDALSCAVEIQDAARAVNEPLPPGRRLELRIGVNLGDVIVADDGDLFGDGVNIAARLQTLAPPGGVCLSQTVYDQVRNKLRLDYRSLGAHRVKNIAEPLRVYAVDANAAKRARPGVPRRGAAIAALAAVVLVAAGLVAWLVGGRIGVVAPLAPAQAAAVAGLAVPARLAERVPVAVLPFKNRSPDSGQDYFSDGITEDIINALGRYPNLLVASRSASFPLKGRHLSPEEIGRILNVRYLVEGSVRRAGDQIRITVELTETATGFDQWSDAYNVKFKDLFALQDKITQRIVGFTAVKLTGLERQRVRRKPTASLAAYELVLRGRAGVNDPTETANASAQALFQRAVAIDPNYAEAYAALGWTHYEAVVSGWTEFNEDEIGKAQALAQKALALDPGTTTAYRLLAEIAVFHRDYDRALQDIDRALALNPSDADTFQARGYILLWSGKPADAASWLQGALRFDPGNKVAAMQLGIADYFIGKYGDAVTGLDQALVGDPGRVIQLNAHPVLAAAYARNGEQEEAGRERDTVQHLSPLFDAERFAAQFGTKEARNDMLTGLKAAGFR